MSKFCYKCKLAIDTNKERYIKIEDIENNKTLSKLLMHKNCWKELMTNKGKTTKLFTMAEKFIKNAQNKIGGEGDETPLIVG